MEQMVTKSPTRKIVMARIFLAKGKGIARSLGSGRAQTIRSWMTLRPAAERIRALRLKQDPVCSPSQPCQACFLMLEFEISIQDRCYLRELAKVGREDLRN